ncbi:hypothetical protein TIFTF001_017246 [Ficus carica]|uniref:Myb/SANT-like domain-containing protein n=1 Tax=Ficus carica TaxID=3494 RepID=A0AA88DAJ7_FICCA|nr:hypothetical protein TIFTF001_017246 [Ficus carica]
MPRKASGETYVWNNAKEKLFLEKLDDFLMCNGGRHPTMPILDLWATQFNAEFGGVPVHGGTLYQKKDKMKRVYRGWKVLQTRTGHGYDPVTDRVICLDEAWQSFMKVNKECNHLRHEGLWNKDLYYNVFEKSHAADAFAFGSVTMGDASTSSTDFDLSMDNSGTHLVFEEEIDPTNGGRQGPTRRILDVAGPSRSRGSAGKRKQRDATDEMTFSALQEIVNHFRGQTQSGTSSDQSSGRYHILECMNIMKEMGIPLNQRTIMWHYFDAHPRL